MCLVLVVLEGPSFSLSLVPLQVWVTQEYAMKLLLLFITLSNIMIDGNVKNILREKLALEIEISFSEIVQYLSSYIPKKKKKRKEMLSF